MIPLMMSGVVIPKEFNNGPSLEFPVLLLIDIYNNLPSNNSLRSIIDKYIIEYVSVNKKSHWASAIFKNEAGELVFSEAEWRRAIYLGKQETRLNTAKEAFEKLKSELEFLEKFMHTESECASQLPPIPGDRLIDECQPSLALRHIKEHASGLSELSQRFQHGLVNNLAGTVPHHDLIMPKKNRGA